MMQDIAESRAKQRAMNPISQKKLIDNGADLSREHDIVNVFYIFADSEISSLEEDLRKHRFEPNGPPKALREKGVQYWIVEAIFQLRPEVPDLNRMTDQCVQIAFSHDAEYDGWYTEVIPLKH